MTLPGMRKLMFTILRYFYNIDVNYCNFFGQCQLQISTIVISANVLWTNIAISQKEKIDS